MTFQNTPKICAGMNTRMKSAKLMITDLCPFKYDHDVSVAH